MTIIICERYPASFWHALKLKATHGQHFATQAGAKHCVFAYIEGFYAAKQVSLRDNTRRMQSSLDHQSRIEFEHEFIDKTKAPNEETTDQNHQSAWLMKRPAVLHNEKLPRSERKARNDWNQWARETKKSAETGGCDCTQYRRRCAQKVDEIESKGSRNSGG